MLDPVLHAAISSRAGAVFAMPWTQDAEFRGAPGWRGDQQFVEMLNAFRSSGGLARAQEVLELCLHRGGPDEATLARWMLRREVLSFDWYADSWMPMFQFDPVEMTPLPVLQPVLAELNGVYAPWELANWFVQPNAWLAGGLPADNLARAARGVLDAARADRFIVSG